MMRRPRPLVALIVNLVLVHAMLVGSGRACGARDVSGSPAGAMAGMDMPAKTPAHQHSPCQVPWAPDGCQVATPCLPLAISSPEQVLRAADVAPTAIATLRVLMPPSRGHPPEP